MDQNTKDILETVSFIKDRMLTKDDVRDITREVIRQEVPAMIRKELKPLHHELKEINRRLDALDEQYKNLKGVTKKIDELRAPRCARSSSNSASTRGLRPNVVPMSDQHSAH